MSLTCPDCNKSYPTLNALRCHMTREKSKPDNLKCISKKRKKEDSVMTKVKTQEAKKKLKELDVTEVVETVNTASKTNELLEHLTEQMGAMKQQNDEIIKQNHQITQQNNQMKEM
eukprot:2792800-Prymnesium_polylepis.1